MPLISSSVSLLCWLKECPSVGVEVIPGYIVHATQYADDTQPLLKSLDPEVVQSFLNHMEVFRRASGQGLNPPKTRLLVIGDTSAAECYPSSICGLQVVQDAKSLGISFSNTPATTCPELWEDLLTRVQASYERISRLGLSVFGRAQAAAAYGVSQILFHVEHLGLPASVGEALHRLTSRLVDKGQVALRSWQRQWPLPGIPSQLLPGRPAEGGFGALPWREHCLARAARWIRRLMVWLAGNPAVLLPSSTSGDASPDPASQVAPAPTALPSSALSQQPPLWVPLARDIVTRLCPAIHPAFTVLALGSPAASPGYLPTCLNGKTIIPEGPLRRWAEGFHALGPASDVSEEPLSVGEWCTSAPLWGNPLLQLELPQRFRTVEWASPPNSPSPEVWTAGYSDMIGFPGLHTLGDLLVLLRTLSKLNRRPLPEPDPYQPFLESRRKIRQHALFTALFGATPKPWISPQLDPLFNNWSPGPGPGYGPDASELFRMVNSLWEAIPHAWRTAAFQSTPTARNTREKTLVPGPPDWHASEAAIRLILNRLGWRRGDQRVYLMGSNTAEESQASLPLSVRSGTQLLMGPTLSLRQAARSHFVKRALSEDATAQVTASDVDTTTAQLKRSMQSLWKLPWENERKETFWRLSVNGVRAAGGHGIVPSGPCACGWVGPPPEDEQPSRAMQLQAHVFWSCPVATAVRATLRSTLSQQPAAPLPCSAVWLLQAPPHTHDGVWAVVCATAVEAMEFGRRYLWALARGQEEAEETLDPTQSLITAFFPVITPSPTATDDLTSARIRRASHRAVAQFWCLLLDFVALNSVPKGWGAVPPDHPFIGVQQAEGEKATLQLNLPPSIVWEDDT